MSADIITIISALVSSIGSLSDFESECQTSLEMRPVTIWQVHHRLVRRETAWLLCSICFLNNVIKSLLQFMWTTKSGHKISWNYDILLVFLLYVYKSIVQVEGLTIVLHPNSIPVTNSIRLYKKHEKSLPFVALFQSKYRHDNNSTFFYSWNLYAINHGIFLWYNYKLPLLV